MYQFITGNIFNSNAHTLVDAVNCLGIKGAGLALQFKQNFPKSFEHYRAHCRDGAMQPGKVLISSEEGGLSIVHFPTKIDWRNPSKLEWIESGLEDLIHQVNTRQIQSIAIPQLGCGLGGLNWVDVRALIIAAAERMPNCRVEIYGAAPLSVARPLVKIRNRK
ncbi:macro domain-containing protein [Chamaesiphon sp.]|uniref:macro domain-containing protein n=1 Tax=Chamaesiphon sp. TaxID=2814140 RepID=UPI0035937557